MIGSNAPHIQVDGFRARRTIRFTAIPGYMMRTLQGFFQRHETIENCRDHLYPTSPVFSCFIAGFTPVIHPTAGDFPGTGEDTYDLEMILIRMN